MIIATLASQEVSMQIRQGQMEGTQLSIRPTFSLRRKSCTCIAIGLASGMFLFTSVAHGQQDPPSQAPHPILLPEANRLPDVNDQMKLHEQNSKKKNFEAANAERKRELDDESAKLLILAKDLKSQTDNMGTTPLTPKATREAEVIEILARDVKEKMKLTIGGS
jgi:hypothetical protein